MQWHNEMERAAIGGPFDGFGALLAPRKALRLLDFLEHLEDAFRRSDEKALVGLAEAATLEGITAGAGSFGHEHHLLVLQLEDTILPAPHRSRKRVG